MIDKQPADSMIKSIKQPEAVGQCTVTYLHQGMSYQCRN